MLQEPTSEKLHAMRLSAMAAAWDEQHTSASVQGLSFDERFGLLVDAEHLARENRQLKRLLKNANLRIPDACVESVKVSATRGLPSEQFRQLANAKWITSPLSLLFTGPTGVGKSYLASAMGQLACRRGYKVAYRRVPRLFEELTLAKADGTYNKLLGKLAKADVLILDDLGLGKLKSAQRHDLLEVLEDRYGTRATIVTSQLPLKQWHEWIDEPTLADAILDRLVHNAYKIALKGPSLRKESVTS